MDIIKVLAEEFKLRTHQVEETVKLIDEGNTIPFIARYRKEVTGGMDDVTLRGLDERLTYLRNLEERKGEVIRLIEEQGALTEELKAQIEEAQVLQRVEDLYKPFKQKKSTRAGKAKARGLEPLADILLAFHIHLYLVEGNVPRPLYHRLHAALAAALDKFAKDVKLAELRGVGGVCEASRP